MKFKFPVRRKQHLDSRKKRKKRLKKPIPRIVVPSFFTLMNLFCGFLSIINTADGNYVLACWLIVIAGLFDSLDGFMARLSNATSDFGIELDSLSDVVSFGVAPGFLIYSASLFELQFVGIMISALPPLCGAVRLARFNVDANESSMEFFKGLPIPAQAIMLAALYLTFHESISYFNELFDHGFNSILTPIIILLSFLMVSTVPFDKIPRFDKENLREKKGQIILFVIYLLLIIILNKYGLILVFTIFIMKGILLAAFQFWYDKFNDDY